MTTQQPTTHSLFLTAWNNVPKIPFDITWKNGTGYLDHVTDDDSLGLNANDFVGTIDDFNRKVLIKGIGSNLQHVVFERFTDGKNEVLVSNSPSARQLSKLDNYYTHGFESSLSKGTIEVFLNLKEPTALFHPNEQTEVLKLIDKSTLVSTGTKIAEDIDNEIPISVALLRSVGIDMESIEVNFLIKEWNV